MQIRLTALLLALSTGPASAQQDPSVEWRAVGHDRGGMRHSPLDQIHRGNVSNLKVAWTWHTGELDRERKKTIECTPLMAEGTLYVTTGHLRVAALDPATGAERWSFDPEAAVPRTHPLASGGVNRGLAWWSNGQPGGERRLFHGTSDGRLWSLDAVRGRLDPAFGKAGVKDLREDLEPYVKKLGYGPTSAPAICGDVVILGVSCGEGPGIAAPGDVRGFDVRTGEQLWRFHTVPREGEPGNLTWRPGPGGEPSWQRRGGANAWGGLNVDAERGLVFAGLGSAAFDFYGGDRPGDNLYANSVVALDARTGALRWYYQTLRHDLWDHDLPTPPVLLELERDGEKIPAAAQVTKTGYVYVFHRETGAPLFEIEQRPVPRGGVDGEQPASYQPIPLRPPPFVRTSFFADDATDLSPESRAAVLERLKTLRHGNAFLPPSERGTVVMPGFHGGATWSGAAFDPSRQYLFVNANNIPNIVTMVRRGERDEEHWAITGYHKFRDPDGYPAIRPPWGVLVAIDLARGEIAWKVPMGEFPELSARGIPPTGTETFGGCIATAGDLIFIGGSKDERFHAFDSDTGRLLWQHDLPAGGYATPCTYSVGGRQYVVIAAGGAGKPGTKAGDAFVAFALPRD